MRYWLEYWCASRSEWLEVTDCAGRPEVWNNLSRICLLADVLFRWDARPRRVVDLHGRVVAYYG